MSKKMMVGLEAASSAGVALIGVKAMNCARLLESGFPIPAGICLTTTAFQTALAPYAGAVQAALSGTDLGGVDGAGRANAQILEMLQGWEAPEGLISGLWRAVRTRFGPETILAVRSSAVEEDQAEHSFAGLYTSVMGVKGAAGLREAVMACWRSYFDGAALSTRGGILGGGMGVLVQPLIPAECAGVCYTLDPVEPESRRAVVNAAWGLGSGVVDGLSAADTWWLTRQPLAVEKERIVEKATEISLGPNGGLEKTPVGEEKSRAACLPTDWVERIAMMSIAAETRLGGALDVEWAAAQGQIWLLQARPIASLGSFFDEQPPFTIQWEDGEEARAFWTQEWPEETHRAALLPLEQDEISAKQTTRADTCRWMGADRNQQVKFCHGRMYVRPIPTGLSPADEILRRQALDDLGQRLAEQGQTDWDYWGAEIVRASERLAAFDFQAADAQQLANHLEQALAARKRHVMLHPMMRFKPRKEYFLAYQRLSGEQGSEADTRAYQLIVSAENMQTRLTDELYELARSAREWPQVVEWLRSAAPNSLERIYEIPGGERFQQQLAEFLARYGERNGAGYGSEATIATPTWREQPEQVLRLAAAFLDLEKPSPAETRRQARAERDARVDELCRKGDAQDAGKFRAELEYAEKSTAVLENHNHYIDQLSLGILRRAALAAGAHLVRTQQIEREEMVMWLKFDEISAALRDEQKAPLQAMINARMIEHARQLKMLAPACLGIPPAGLGPRPPLETGFLTERTVTPGRLTGLGASRGIARGRARVILDPGRLAVLQPGEVLVAANIGPLWNSVLPLIAGLVLDGGSLGQHPATAAREYSVPAVIDTGDATRRITDGDLVTVDGSNGWVQIEAGVG